MGNPVADPSHPFWDVMKQAIGTPENTPGKQPAISGIPAYEDGGYVHGKSYDTDGTPIYDVGRPGLGGAVHDLVDSLTHGGVSRAQKIAADNTARRVNTNETGKPDGYANGGVVAPSEPSTRHGPDHDKTVHYSAIAPDPEGNLRRMDNWSARAALGDDKVRKLIAVDRANGYEQGGYVSDIPHADDVTRPSITSAIAIGHALGRDAHQDNLAQQGREAREAALESDNTPDPNAGKPGLLAQAGQAIGHPISAVRAAVTDLADFIGHPLHSHTRNQGIDAAAAPAPVAASDPAAAGAPPAASSAGQDNKAALDAAKAGALAPDSNKLLSPDLSKTPAPTPEAAVVQGAAPKEAIPASVQQASQQAKAGADTAHSLTPDFWNGVHQRAIHAAHLAARAGLDPKEVYDSSMAMAVTHMQGQVMRSYGAAFNALQANNMDLVKKSLNDANFYLPDGKELEFSKNPVNGSLQVRNPFIGLPGHEKDQEMMDITPENISLMATAQLHPETFHTELAAFAKAGTDAKKDAEDSASKRLAAQGSADRGLAARQRAQTDARKAPSVIFRNIAAGDKDEWKANSGTTATGQPKITLSQADKVGTNAQAAVHRLMNGYSTPVPQEIPKKDADGNPIIGPNGKPVMTPNLSLAAGKTIPDPKRIPIEFKGLPPEAENEIAQNAATIARANAAGTRDGAGVGNEEAATIAAKIYQFNHGYTYNDQTGQLIKSGAGAGKHVDPTTKPPNVKLVPDVVQGLEETGPNKGKPNGILHVWMGNHWANIYQTENVGTQAIDTGSGAGGGAETNPDDAADAAADAAADNAPAE